jgi:GMP synthase (glutamine-hydrolysing)
MLVCWSMEHPSLLIVELGSQYTLLIARALRELGYRSAVLDPHKAALWLQHNTPKGIILSGGPSSVYQENAPQPPAGIFNNKVPLLGVCYGMQWLAEHLGGSVRNIEGQQEYGPAEITIEPESILFGGLSDTEPVWASHGDSVVHAPRGSRITARSEAGGIAAFEDLERLIFGVQFHPEVAHSPRGKVILQNFMDLCRIQKDWAPSSIIHTMREQLRAAIGGKKAIMAFSGGVDSTVLAAIAAPVLGERLHGVTIDTGNLREGEMDEIKLHAKAAGLPIKVVDARASLVSFSNTIDAEEKRSLFRNLYTSCFAQEAAIFGSQYFLQGTLAPDLIESGATGGDIIKTHHNVGLSMGMQQMHPLRDLFKYEVRALAEELGLPESVSKRKPFPGPGLLVRIVGVPVMPELLDLVRWADARTQEVLQKYKMLEQVSQLVVAYLGVNTVGVKGDGRVYRGIIAVRAIHTSDFMTAEGIAFASEIQKEISEVITKHPLVVHVGFFPTDKPPATTEFE